MLARVCLAALLSAVQVFAVPASRSRTAETGLLVETSSGLIEGFFNSSAPDVRQFLGVPFAEPPVGDLRFARPQEAKSKGKVKAQKLPNSCMQQFSNSSTIYTEYETEFLINGGNSEDCLYLSIWAPRIENIQSQQRPLPVLLYIPGGGFTSGGQNSLYKIPDQWVQRTQSHIVIVMNYRVNIFGFPNAAGLEDQNLGLLDQRLAVEWVHANVGNFGGDPERITLWGQSAGAASSSVYPYGYPENPLIAGVIADSGSPTIVTNSDTAHTNFTFIAGLVGCGNLSADKELSCVRKVPGQTLENALSYYSSNGTKPSVSFTPIVDNKTVFANYTQRILDGKISKTPLIIGSNSNEGAGFVSFTPDGPGAEALATATKIISCPVNQEVKNRNIGGLPTYRYEYAGNFSNISPLSWFSAYHSSELPLLFGTHNEYRGRSTKFEWDVSYAMEALWLSFAEDPTRGPARVAIGDASGNPNNESYFAWPEFQQGSSNMLLFAKDNKLMQLISSESIDKSC
ncbi:chlorogenic acid esterase precursor [Aspergillus caelatus]|uniref:Carboxylic ester hydrolase n=2 Tax=Aspergillus subgen. Circumdati TaxID=2720871 RepID=A0A5N7AF24_9EURO|nr:chlorogenic acid esterase precursor [Aspergillus caelatus]KAE8368464.1 chlorogenic acid esterase precursor [Aspergillus caelatus]KAE8417957.1 chlorogenic acid esterase precursor [Aspergillus pseudocaelatus]